MAISHGKTNAAATPNGPAALSIDTSVRKIKSISTHFFFNGFGCRP
jgi:hypothetical protein